MVELIDNARLIAKLMSSLAGTRVSGSKMTDIAGDVNVYIGRLTIDRRTINRRTVNRRAKGDWVLVVNVVCVCAIAFVLMAWVHKHYRYVQIRTFSCSSLAYSSIY
jgi:hypothetical protein